MPARLITRCHASPTARTSDFHWRSVGGMDALQPTAVVPPRIESSGSTSFSTIIWIHIHAKLSALVASFAAFPGSGPLEASLRAAALDDATNLVFTASGLIPARSPDEIGPSFGARSRVRSGGIDRAGAGRDAGGSGETRAPAWLGASSGGATARGAAGASRADAPAGAGAGAGAGHRTRSVIAGSAADGSSASRKYL